MAIIFHNKSTLPLECISTFGVSAKDTSSPIGYFGTGLKYAIAVLMREGCEILMHIDGEAYEFRTESRTVRTKEFGFIYMNDEALPFTIELGKNWKLWQAYRELYSNCIDEGGEISESAETADADISSGTIIIVKGLDEIHQTSSGFILRSEPKHVLDGMEIHENMLTSGVFYKGIKVLDLPTKYTYNVLTGLTLTEDRTVSQYSAEEVITTTISDSSDLAMLMDILSIEDEVYHEAKFNWQTYHEPSEAFMRLVAKLKKKSHALATYYNRHEPAFLGKMDRAILSTEVHQKLKRLRASMKYQPAEILIATMDKDYKIIPEGLILNAALLKDAKKLNFVYQVACHRMANKISSWTGDYEIIVKYMLADFKFTTPRQRKIQNSKGRKAA